MQAMILAAGFGTRLLPHTLLRPKPLFPILNRPLLLLTIQRLQNLGFDHIVVNCHHLRNQIVVAIDGLEGVVVQEEESILGTGGGLRKALAVIRDEPLLVTNGDIYHTVDLLDVYNFHTARSNTVTLAMHDYPRYNSATVKDNRITGFDGGNGPGRLAFTGIHVVAPQILEAIESTTQSCIIDHYRKLLGNDGVIDCYRSDGTYWTDMGTPGDYLALHGGLLTGNIPCWQELQQISGPFCIAANAQMSKGSELQEWVSIGSARIAEECHLERVVIWDDVEVSPGRKLVDMIVSSNL